MSVQDRVATHMIVLAVQNHGDLADVVILRVVYTFTVS